MGKKYKWVMLALLSCAFFFHQADRALFGLLTIPIQQELGLPVFEHGTEAACTCTDFVRRQHAYGGRHALVGGAYGDPNAFFPNIESQDSHDDSIPLYRRTSRLAQRQRGSCDRANVGAKSARAPVVPEIGLKDKRIGLLAMRAGLKAKIGCHRGPQRRAIAAAVRPTQQRGPQRRGVAAAVGSRNNYPIPL